jgi:hypothetical protein
VAETSFEFRLERLFAETPARADADLFALRVLERLDCGWTARRLLIGAMGALGGLIGAYEIVGSGAVGQLAALAARSNAFMSQHLASLLSAPLAPAGIYVDAEAIWLAVALAVVAAGFGLARLVREI